MKVSNEDLVKALTQGLAQAGSSTVAAMTALAKEKHSDEHRPWKWVFDSILGTLT